MKRFIYVVSIASLFLFQSCLSTGFSRFYYSSNSGGSFPEEAYLSENEIPVIKHVTDIETEFREVCSNWNWCIGQSGYNGEDCSESIIKNNLLKLCKEKKAKLAIYTQQYTNTEYETYSVPNTQYNYYTDGNGVTHSYTTTTYTTQSYSVNKYDYFAYLFVEIPEDYRMNYAPGISISDLTQKEREIYKQNTGCFVEVVYVNTPAFFANLVYGDIITKINDENILSIEDFYNIQKTLNPGDTCSITFVRDGTEKTVTLKYGI